MKKIKNLVCIILVLSCKQEKEKLPNINWITNKKIVIPNSVSGEMYNLGLCALEKDIYFNKNGKITKLGKSQGEGLLFFYRNPQKNELSLDDNELSFRIKVDIKRNLIIENQDTIRNFRIQKNKIITNKNKNGRIFIYSFI